MVAVLSKNMAFEDICAESKDTNNAPSSSLDTDMPVENMCLDRQDPPITFY